MSIRQPPLRGFTLSNGECLLPDVRQVWASLRHGYGAERIPRKTKKQLKREWLYWRPWALRWSPLWDSLAREVGTNG